MKTLRLFSVSQVSDVAQTGSFFFLDYSLLIALIPLNIPEHHCEHSSLTHSL